MWSIIFSRSVSGNSVAITFRLLLLFFRPPGDNERKLRISDNLDASGKCRDANLLHSSEFLHNPTRLAREQHSLCEVEGVWKKGILHGNGGKIYKFFSVRQTTEAAARGLRALAR
jgi:hypothetical protein